MYKLIAKNAKQLDICLRLLHSEKQEFEVKISESDGGKIEYIVEVKTDEMTFSEIEREYKILI